MVSPETDVAVSVLQWSAVRLMLLMMLSVLQLMEEEEASLQAEVRQVVEQGEQLLQAAENCRDPVTHARVSSRLQELKVRTGAVRFVVTSLC